MLSVEDANTAMESFFFSAFLLFASPVLFSIISQAVMVHARHTREDIYAAENILMKLCL